jgi:hypothetical protein
VNCLNVSFLESTQLSPQFQKFAMQCIALARHLLSQLLDPEAEPPLAHNRRDGKNRSG